MTDDERHIGEAVHALGLIFRTVTQGGLTGPDAGRALECAGRLALHARAELAEVLGEHVAESLWLDQGWPAD